MADAKQDHPHFAYAAVYRSIEKPYEEEADCVPTELWLRWSEDFVDWLQTTSAYGACAAYQFSLIVSRVTFCAGETTSFTLKTVEGVNNRPASVQYTLCFGKDFCRQRMNLFPMLEEAATAALADIQADAVDYSRYLAQSLLVPFRNMGEEFKKQNPALYPHWEFSV